MMQFTIERTYFPKGTLGLLRESDGSPLCVTIERAHDDPAYPCIPEGVYVAVRYNSPKHGPNTWLLINVPGRSYIEFHVADFPHELKGCIAPGTAHCLLPTDGEPYVERSAEAYKHFMDLTKNETQIEFVITHGPDGQLPVAA